MKLFALSAAIAALTAVATATPAGHMNLAKRAIVATQTIISGGNTYVQLVDAVEATEVGTTTVVHTNTVTETDASYVFSYSGDESSIIAKLQSVLSELLAAYDAPSSSEESSSREEWSFSEESSSEEASSGAPVAAGKFIATLNI
ncbi:MAG: hypothetical protein EXX96DRAFT_549009 [Benjaminiella poitrasii]|nr:MAG: hypothetical protein EXX96DRAFT_549009 [Benjaminiella poitrasii]